MLAENDPKGVAFKCYERELITLAVEVCASDDD
jgi:hypothetical protein